MRSGKTPRKILSARLLNKYNGRTLIDEVQEGNKVVKERRVVIEVIWMEDEPGYDAP